MNLTANQSCSHAIFIFNKHVEKFKKLKNLHLNLLYIYCNFFAVCNNYFKNKNTFFKFIFEYKINQFLLSA